MSALPEPVAKRPVEPDKARGGNIKVTRQEWLQAARNTLVSEGVAEVKILTIANELDVARSSFYWYFDSHADLLDALLGEWEARNTQCIVDKCSLPANNLTKAVCHFFECFIDDELFDQGLDFAVREWSRRDVDVRAKIDAADKTRLKALTDLFEKFGFDFYEADVRARILYFMQLGYHALEIREPMDERLERLEGYIKGFTGEVADPEVVADLKARAMKLGGL